MGIMENIVSEDWVKQLENEELYSLPFDFSWREGNWLTLPHQGN